MEASRQVERDALGRLLQFARQVKGHRQRDLAKAGLFRLFCRGRRIKP
jgi:hypothetical protein